MSQEELDDLLKRYTQDIVSPEEQQQVENWLESESYSNAEWHQLNLADKNKWLSGVFADIKNTIQADKTKLITLPTRRAYTWRTIAVVAAAIVIIAFGLFLNWPIFTKHFGSNQIISLSAAIGKKKQIKLADGSQVWLNAGSTLRYPLQFTGDKREVWLSGEAYFDIRHQQTQPFIIHTGNILTTVLGTAFNIKEDKIKNSIVVTVTRGKVSVANGRQLLGILIPNQQIAFNILANTVALKTVDAQQTIAWQQNDLHFEDVSFGEAAKQLEDHFGVSISFVNDQLKNCRFTGTSLKGESLDHILKVMCAFNHTTYQRQPDGSITISGTGCN